MSGSTNRCLGMRSIVERREFVESVAYFSEKK
jgi:hypothetical protein